MPGLIARAALLAIGAACASSSAAQDMVARYRCTVAGGATVWMAQPLAADYPGSVVRCSAVAVASTAPVNIAEPKVPAGVQDGETVTVLVRTISSPQAVLAAAPSSASTLISAPSAPPMVAAAAATISTIPAQLFSWLRTACRQYGVDHALAAAVMYTESRFQPTARSPKGALGLMQLMPATATRYGVRTEKELLDPRINIDVGVRHLRDLLDRFEGRPDLAVAAYNAGEGAVVRYGYRVPPYAETQQYVQQVLAYRRGGLPPM